MPISGWDDAATARLAGEQIKTVWLFRLDDTGAPLRYWSGDFDFLLPGGDVVETSAAIYSGLGEIVQGLPSIPQLINGQADSVVFTLSGVTDDMVAAAASDMETIQGRTLNLGFLCLDGDLQPVTPTCWFAALEAQFLTVDRPQTTDEPSRTISMTATTLFAIRRQAPCNTFTAADQRRRSSDDAAFDRVHRYTLGTTRNFGPSDAGS